MTTTNTRRRPWICPLAIPCLALACLLNACDRAAEAEPAGPVPQPQTEAPGQPGLEPAPPSPSRAATPSADTIGEKERRFRDEIVASCLEHLWAVSRDAAVVEAVKVANQSNRATPEEILETDKRWRHAKSQDDPLILPYLTNPCAAFLRRIQADHTEYAEVFVMDAKGCIVCESNKTSDYWQGDEEKWTRSFNEGKGQVFVSEIEYDQSTQSYVIQVSLPVNAGDGAAIGAMTVSIFARKKG